MIYPSGHEFNYMTLRPSEISIDPLYQRSIDVKRIEKIAKNFNGDTFNEPKVSFRDGKYWCFDGQHSIAAWRKVNSGEDKPLLCKIFRGMTWLEEADAFIAQNGLAKDPTTNEKLRAAYAKRDPDVVGMVDGAEMVGFVVDFQRGRAAKRILATSALFRAYKLLGGYVFTNMLTAIREAWNFDADSMSASIISGMASFYHHYFGNFDQDNLIDRLKRHRPADIIRNGKNVTTPGNGYERAILQIYNRKKTKQRLKEIA